MKIKKEGLDQGWGRRWREARRGRDGAREGQDRTEPQRRGGRGRRGGVVVDQEKLLSLQKDLHGSE